MMLYFRMARHIFSLNNIHGYVPYRCTTRSCMDNVLIILLSYITMYRLQGPVKLAC